MKENSENLSRSLLFICNSHKGLTVSTKINKSQTSKVKPLEGSVSLGHNHVLAIKMDTKDMAPVFVEFERW